MICFSTLSSDWYCAVAAAVHLYTSAVSACCLKSSDNTRTRRNPLLVFRRYNEYCLAAAAIREPAEAVGGSKSNNVIASSSNECLTERIGVVSLIDAVLGGCTNVLYESRVSIGSLRVCDAM